MYIVSVSTDARTENIPEVQEVLTQYGKNITTRLGIHNPDKENTGVIIITYVSEDVEEFVETLNSIHDVTANFMEV